jgi:hypothetical protein
MKKFCVLVVLLLTVAISDMRAIPMDCVPDCPEDQFNYNCPVFTTTFGTCTIRIYWGYRIACEQYYDIIITGIDYWGDCAFLSENDMLSFAAIYIMKSDFVRNTNTGLGWPVPQGPGDCVTNWRVNKWSCWRHQPIPFAEYDRLVACNNEDPAPCCLTWYKICLDNLNREIISIEDEGGPNIPCPTAPGWLPCIKVCD